MERRTNLETEVLDLEKFEGVYIEESSLVRKLSVVTRTRRQTACLVI